MGLTEPANSLHSNRARPAASIARTGVGHWGIVPSGPATSLVASQFELDGRMASGRQPWRST
jgi:hypothetical protein